MSFVMPGDPNTRSSSRNTGTPSSGNDKVTSTAEGSAEAPSQTAVSRSVAAVGLGAGRA
jgi:hypothetical protein